MGKKIHLTYRETRMIIIVEFSTETMQAKREWNEVSKAERKKTSKLEFYI